MKSRQHMLTFFLWRSVSCAHLAHAYSEKGRNFVDGVVLLLCGTCCKLAHGLGLAFIAKLATALRNGCRCLAV